MRSCVGLVLMVCMLCVPQDSFAGRRHKPPPEEVAPVMVPSDGKTKPRSERHVSYEDDLPEPSISDRAAAAMKTRRAMLPQVKKLRELRMQTVVEEIHRSMAKGDKDKAIGIMQAWAVEDKSAAELIETLETEPSGKETDTPKRGRR